MIPKYFQKKLEIIWGLFGKTRKKIIKKTVNNSLKRVCQIHSKKKKKKKFFVKSCKTKQCLKRKMSLV